MKYFYLTLFLLLSSGLYSQGGSSNKYKTEFKKAKGYYDQEEFQQSAKYAKRSYKSAKRNQDRYNSLLLIGSSYTNLGQYESALKCFWKAKRYKNLSVTNRVDLHDGMSELFHEMKAPTLEVAELVRSFKLENDFFKAGKIGNLFLELNKKDSALFYFERQIRIARAENNSNKLIFAFNNIGYGLSEVGKDDEALGYYNKALTLYEETPIISQSDSLSIGLLHGNIGMIYLKKGQYDIAFDHLNKDYQACKRYTSDPDLLVYVAEGLFEALGKLGFEERQKELIQDLSRVKANMSNEMLISFLHMELQYYQGKEPKEKYSERLFKYNEKAKNALVETNENAMYSADLLASLKLKEVQSELKLSILENRIARQKYESTRLYFILGLLGVASVVIFLLGRRRQERIKARLLKAEKQQLDAELKLKKAELTDFAINISRNKEFANEIASQLKRAKRMSDTELRKELNNIAININNTQYAASSLEFFQANIDKINKDFFVRLGQLHPSLSKQEKEKCGLIRLRLSNKEIASIRNISHQSARNARHRIKKKLNLEEGQSLESYLSEI